MRGDTEMWWHAERHRHRWVSSRSRSGLAQFVSIEIAIVSGSLCVCYCCSAKAAAAAANEDHDREPHAPHAYSGSAPSVACSEHGGMSLLQPWTHSLAVRVNAALEERLGHKLKAASDLQYYDGDAHVSALLPPRPWRALLSSASISLLSVHSNS